MEKALVENNVEFAKLLIKNNFQIDKFLSYDSELKFFYVHSKFKDKDCVFKLYNYFINDSSKEKTAFILYLESKKSKNFQDCFIYEIKNLIEKSTGLKYLLFLDTYEYLVKTIIENFFPIFNASIENSEKLFPTRNIQNVHHLFIWSVLCERNNIAEIFLDKAEVINIFLILSSIDRQQYIFFLFYFVKNLLLVSIFYIF
jgi:hypothetical protein